jgi:peptidylprolyl isomerase
MIAGFDRAVIGMSVGESKTVRLSPEEAYGPYREDLVMVMDRELVPPAVQVGEQVTANVPGSGTVVFTVTKITETEVTLDANHHLAGEYLTFEIELVEID